MEYSLESADRIGLALGASKGRIITSRAWICILLFSPPLFSLFSLQSLG